MRDSADDGSRKEYRMKQIFTQAGLRETESRCVADEPPFCAAECPLHIDGRALAREAAAGNFAKARRHIEAATPFVRALADGCVAPCVKKCRLAEIGDGVDLSLIEKKCAETPAAPRRRLPVVKKNKSVVAAGGDLFCAAAAYELDKKGYTVKMICPNLDGLKNLLGDEFKILTFSIENREFNPLEAQNYDIAVISNYADYVDPKTFFIKENIFSAPKNSVVVHSLAYAKIAAASADRLIQGIPIDKARAKENSFVSKLFTNLSETAPSQRLSDAQAEAARCIQCQCDECVKGCAYLAYYKRNPKQTTREIYNNLSIVMGDHMANTLINSCALCGQCTAICPNGYELPKVCRLAREAMTVTGKMPPSAHEFALLDMKFSMGPEYFYATPQKSNYIFFPGCQLGALLPDSLLKTYGDLKTRLEDCGVLLGCCGVMARWAGQEEMFENAIAQIKTALAERGDPVLITACPTCHETLGEFFKVMGIWDLDYKITDSETYYIHDACGARNTGIHEKIRALGANIAEPKYNKDVSPCCGYGGLQTFANKEIAAAMTEFAAARLKEPVLTYCANCDDRFARAGKTSRHVLELIFGPEPAKNPTLSGRRANRKRVRRELGGEIFIKSYNYKLIIPDETRAQMENRMILDEDIYGVIESARENGEIVSEKSSGLHIARARIGNVTFWVKYVLDNNNYVIKSAYSHRMTVEKA